MAATVFVASQVTVTPTTGGTTEKSLSFTSSVAPAEIVSGQAVVGNTAFTLDLGDIAAGKGYILWLYAITGNFYFKLGVTSGTPLLTDAQLYVREGEAYPVPVNPNATAMPGVRGISDSATGKLEYLLVGGA